MFTFECLTWRTLSFFSKCFVFGVIKYKDGRGPFKRTLWVALASTCLCAGFSSKSKGTNHQVVLSFMLERAFHTDLNHSLRYTVPENTVLDFTHGL